ncbi:MAG: 4Fe-4S dicluster domain-containing protein [Alphaproteobacteria bacterium]|nr:4Fe-4S dicluster domain-containing protein [Alphaproteobacteria bacterium]
MMDERLILFCRCRARYEMAGWVEGARIVKNHHETCHYILDDLCGLCAEDPGKISNLVNGARQVLLIACHSRAVKLLLHNAGVDGVEKFLFFNLLEQDPAGLMTVIRDFIGERMKIPSCGNPGTTLLQSNLSWPAWYPVIDDSRCNRCGQCADFCLFGVYRKSGDNVTVTHPQNCKNNCPACARICPAVAIVFPKYTGGGAIAGSEGFDERSEIQRMQQDTDEILGNDIYQALEQRRMKRRSIIREDSLQKAITERDEALKQAGSSGEAS